MKRLINMIASSPLSPYFYRFATEFYDRIQGENNDDIRTNGELDFIKSQIKQCETVFDGGANTGEWTKFVLALNKNASVHCFEPIGEIYRKLLLNHFPGNVITNNVGLSSANGHGTIYKEVYSLYKRTGLEAGYGINVPVETEIIDLITLDSYCEKNGISKIDLLKLDIEGHEFDALRGSENMIASGRLKRIQFEYGGCYIDAKILLKDIFELFDGHDYFFYKLLPKRLLRIPAYDQRLENFKYKNFAILHKSVVNDQ